MEYSNIEILYKFYRVINIYEIRGYEIRRVFYMVQRSDIGQTIRCIQLEKCWTRTATIFHSKTGNLCNNLEVYASQIARFVTSMTRMQDGPSIIDSWQMITRTSNPSLP